MQFVVVQRGPVMVNPVDGCSVGFFPASGPGRCSPDGRCRHGWCPVCWLRASLRWRVALPYRLLKDDAAVAGIETGSYRTAVAAVAV